MVVQLQRSDFLRLQRRRGAWIEVISGLAWITEEGRAADQLLEPGSRYRVRSRGLVLVSAGDPDRATRVAVLIGRKGVSQSFLRR